MSTKSNTNSVSGVGDPSLEQQIDDFIKSANGLQIEESDVQTKTSREKNCSSTQDTKPPYLAGKTVPDAARSLRDLYQTNTPTLSTSDDSDSDEIIQRGAYADAKMRVGRDYQAIPSKYVGSPGSRCASPDRALCVWTPVPESGGTTEAQVSSFVELARERYGYSAEQALGMLYWHRHNVDLATADLPNFVPHPDEWTHEEKVVFEQAFSFQGKQFNKIIHALPDKTVQHLVKYYYTWKKTRAKASMLDRRGEGGDSASECSDGELPEMRPGCRRVRRPRRKAATARPAAGDGQQHKRRIPRGIFVDYDAFLAMSRQSFSANAAILSALDQQIVTARTRVQQGRAELTQRWEALLSEVQAYQEPDTEGQISYKWTDEELLLAVQGVRRYGKDFRAIAQLIGSKTENHVRYFFAQYRSKFGLDSVLAEFHKDRGQQAGGEDTAAR